MHAFRDYIFAKAYTRCSAAARFGCDSSPNCYIIYSSLFTTEYGSTCEQSRNKQEYDKWI